MERNSNEKDLHYRYMQEIREFVSNYYKFLDDQEQISALDLNVPKVSPNYRQSLPDLPYSNLINQAEADLINLMEEKGKFDEDFAKFNVLKEIDKHVAPYLKQQKMHEKSISQTLDLLEIKNIRSKTNADQF